MLNEIVGNKGYSMIACMIFDRLDNKSLVACRRVSKSMANFIGDQKFWYLRKLWAFIMEDPPKRKLLARNIKLIWLMKKGIALVKKHPEWKIVYDFLKQKKGQAELRKLVELFDKQRRHRLNVIAQDFPFLRFSETASIFGEWSPLQYAIYHGDIDFVNFLLNTYLGESFNPFPKLCKLSFAESSTVPHLEIGWVGDFAWVPEPFDEQIKENVLDEDSVFITYETGCTVFHIACYRGHTEIVKRLFKHSKEKKIDFRKFSNWGIMPESFAKDDPELIEVLLEHCEKNRLDHISKETFDAIEFKKFKEKHQGKLEDFQSRKRKYLEFCEDIFDQLYTEDSEEQLKEIHITEQLSKKRRLVKKLNF